ncbi:MAG: FAD-dependent oxidoreductase [Oscillospiraceae bacterium]|jgi:NAD(P)H-nitrite reductase large subunit|nr:FAD-dependent oxidoreductase [Oscillospiraceae bacterium]
MKYVIIGNSTAAVGCVEGIRSADKTGEIVMISNEVHHTYSRPLISYLISGKTDRERMKYRPDSFCEDNGCSLITGETVVKIDAENREVLLADGSRIAYGKLLVATGSAPFIPPAPGYDGVESKFTFMSLDDAEALAAAVTPESRVLIVGAGLIGLKCAEGIHEKVGSITVVDLADRILPSILDSTGSEIVKRHIEEKGVSFILGDSAAEFKGNTAVLKSGRELAFDILVTAVGVRPNVSLVKDAGGAVGRGIAVDSMSRTDLENVYAAGDCTECYDISAEERRVLALLPNAYIQGYTAGVNMAGGEARFDNAIPMNAIGFFGLHMITAGSYAGESYERIKDGKEYKRLITKDGLLKGYILIGDVRRAGIYTSLIRERTPLDTIDFELIKDSPQLMAFSKKERAAKLGVHTA